MSTIGNLFRNLPQASEKEAFENILSKPGVTVQRIVSHGQTSAPDFWYEQAWDEWVVLLSGSATLAFEDDAPAQLVPGDYLFIPAGKRHRVLATALDRPSVWLAVHLAGADKLVDDTLG
jgi:cupin 2 domain-containing protein